MRKLARTHGGFTLVEVLVSVGVLIIFLPFAASMITNSQLLASYSKHKIQAAYAAQQLIENERQSTFISLTAGQSKTIPPSGSNAVILDTKGNYSSSSCTNATTGDFCGTAVMTITPATFISTAGVKATNVNIDRVSVTISWIERIINLQVPVTQTYAEDIANDTMLN